MYVDYDGRENKEAAKFALENMANYKLFSPRNKLDTTIREDRTPRDGNSRLLGLAQKIG